MVHGGTSSGSGYLRTVDGRPGWAYRFVEHGYRVVTPDLPGCGRSGQVAPEDHGGDLVVRGLSGLIESLPPPIILMTHSMSGAFGWTLLERHGARISRLVAVAPARPGNISPEPQVLSETADEIELQAGALRFQLKKGAPFRPDRDFVEKKLVGNSRLFPRAQMEAYTATLLPIPARLIFERLNIGGVQQRVRDPQPLPASKC